MKKLVLLAVMALTLTACGEKAEKKEEGKAAATMQQSTTDSQTPASDSKMQQGSQAAPASNPDNAAATDAAKPE